MAKGFTKNQVEQAKKTALNNIIFYGSSAVRGVTFEGFDVMEKLLRPKKYVQAVEELKKELRNIERGYMFWVAIYREVDDGVEIDTYCHVHHELTVPEIDLWLNDFITQCIHERIPEKCLGYGWVGTPCMYFDFDVEEENLIKIFEDQGIYDQEKRQKIIQQYTAEQIAKMQGNL